jgi:hypothetical protein
MHHLPVNVPDFPPTLESVRQAVTAERLRVLSAASTDPLVLLGLGLLARSGGPVRQELAELAVGQRSEYAPITALLSVMLDRVDENSIGELVRKDPDNAIGHYLAGTLLHISNAADEAFAEFKRAAGCAEMRFYGATIREALFRALRAADLQESDRVCALSWATSRWLDFSSFGIQPIYGAIPELANNATPTTRHELAEILLALGGHLFVVNFTNRWFALRAVEAALILRAGNEAGTSPAKGNGYAAAVYGLAMPLLSVPGLKEWWHRSPQQLAQFLPARIHQAFAAATANPVDIAATEETGLTVEELAVLKTARERATTAAGKLVEVALLDPDTTFGAYFQEPHGIGTLPKSGPTFDWTAVDGLLTKRPDLFKAAAANEEAMAALWQAGENTASRKNASRMLEIAWALCRYAQTHDHVYPPTLDALFESGHLKAPLELNSVKTRRPYVYVAGNRKMPTKGNDRARFVVLYDDDPLPGGWYECALSSCTTGGARESDLREQLRGHQKQAE